MQWDQGTNKAEWFDIVGLQSQYLQLEYIATFASIVPGSDYNFRVKAQNAFGLSVEWSPVGTVTANSKPDPVVTPTTTVFDKVSVRIAWDYPSDNFSPLLQYEILIQGTDGQFYSHPDCAGSDPFESYCDVSISSLRQTPFLLLQNSVVRAKVRA